MTSRRTPHRQTGAGSGAPLAVRLGLSSLELLLGPFSALLVAGLALPARVGLGHLFLVDRVCHRLAELLVVLEDALLEAKPEVVAKERERLEESRSLIGRLEASLEQVSGG